MEKGFNTMEIREYKVYNDEEILPLYASAGWTAYTDQPEILRKGFENSMLTWRHTRKKSF